MCNQRSTAEKERKKKKRRHRRSAIDRNLSRLFSFFLIPYRATFFRNVPSLDCCVTVPHKDYISYVVRIANALPRPLCALRHSGLINVPLENWKDLHVQKRRTRTRSRSRLQLIYHFRNISVPRAMKKKKKRQI